MATQSKSYTGWTTVDVIPAVRWKVSLRKNNCLYFNSGARMHVVVNMPHGIDIVENKGALYMVDGEKHITTGPREAKVYSKLLCNKVRERYPGVLEFALIQADDGYLIQPMLSVHG